MLFCESLNKHTGRMENQEAKQEFAELSKYLYRTAGIIYAAQAAAIGVTPSRFSSMRKDKRYVVTKDDVAALREAYRQELAGFGQPSPLDLELRRLQAKLDQKDKVIERLSALLDPAAAQALLEKIQEITARLEEE